MSSSIKKNRITLTRGDTFRAKLTLKDKNGEEYTPEEGDKIRFALKHPEKNLDDSEYVDRYPIIVKEVPIDTLIFKLDPEDTKDLGFGTYVYDMELTYANGDVDTFITECKFILTGEVY